MKKRAQTDLIVATLIGLILLVIIISLMLIKIYQEASSYRYDKKFLSQDIAMFIDSIYASPNKMIVKYPQKIYDYSFIFEEGKVTVFKESETVLLGESFPFTEESKVEFEYKTLTSPTVNEGNVEVVGTAGIESVPIIFTKSRSRLNPFLGIIIEDIR